MLLPALLVVAGISAACTPAAGEETLLLRFRAEAVDGVDELVGKGLEASLVHREWSPNRGAVTEVLAPPADVGARRLAVRARKGRPAVSVAQRPHAGNGHELRVRIDDGPAGGAAPLEFELWALPVKPTPRPVDVVVITIDSLRPDHLGCYGYVRPTSPHLDAFAKQGVRYANAFSTSSFTPPSHASLMTSRQVGDHGLLTWNALPDSELTLAEILSVHGYRTGASVNLTMLSENNLGQGVEWQREGGRDARTIVGEALEFVRRADERPYFLWLHFYDVHRPYGRAEGWTERFGKHPRPGLGDGEDDYNLKPEQVKKQKLGESELASLVDRYDAGIAYTDDALAPLLAELAKVERARRTLVTITADHGESLREHPERLFSHDPFLFASVGRVPLLVRYPDGLGAGKTRTDPASLIDVAPTVLATLGLEPPPTFAGRSLRELESEGVAWPDRVLYQECWGWERLASARTPQWFVLSDLKRKTTRLYALASDPGELAPLDPSTRAEAAELVKRLETFAGRRPIDGPPPALDPELVRRLRGLGYTDGDDDG